MVVGGRGSVLSLPSSITVTVTLVNGVITAIKVTPHATDPTSLDFQRCFAAAIPAVVVGKRIEEVKVLILRQLLLVARHPVYWHGAINRHAGFVYGDLGESIVAAGNLQCNQSSIAVSNKQGRAGLLVQGKHIITLFEDAVILALRAASTSPAALDGVDRETFR
jgi:hypothetical protein